MRHVSSQWRVIIGSAGKRQDSQMRIAETVGLMILHSNKELHIYIRQ